MNFTLWVAAGGLIGAAAFAVLHLNVRRGLIFSVAIGIVAALLGGHMLAPLLGATVADTADFSPFAFVVAAGSALACLSISDMAAKRFGL